MLRLLAKDPLDRPASALEAAEALAAVEWELEEVASPGSCTAVGTPTVEGPDRAGEESARAPEPERDVLLEEGRDALGTWRRLEDRWLGRRLFERRYERVEQVRPILAALCEATTGRLPILVRCDPGQGVACWIEPCLPAVDLSEPAAPAELRLLLEESIAVLGGVPEAWAHGVGHGLGPLSSIGRLPDGTCVLTSVDPLIPT
jgi:hypothetical protein